LASWTALAATIGAPSLFLAARLSLDQTKLVMLLGTVVWFSVTPFWMGRPKVDEELVI
jgi:hypothetical protein